MLTNVPSGKVVTDISIDDLLVMLNLLVKLKGIATLDSPHHRWKLIIAGGSIALADEEEFMLTFVRKLRGHKIKLVDAPKKLSGIQLCDYVSQIYDANPEPVRSVIREIQFENLLAITLESRFSLLWQSTTAPINITFPIWSLASLMETVKNTEVQWRDFAYVRHPYQKIQLIDDETTLVHVPLFAKVTGGQHRLSEIADEFKQSLTRTALRFDKLADRRLVAILPLTIRTSENHLDTDRQSYEQSLNEVPRVIVVDDSPVLLKQFGDLLEYWGYQTMLSSDATSATEKMLEFKPDIVFLDINMPGLNGFELIKQIRRQAILSSIPIVLVTAENNIANSMRAKWAKCYFLAKPRTADATQDFRQQLRNILREFVPLPGEEPIPE